MTKFPRRLTGQTPPARLERKAIFDVLVEIRDLLGTLVETEQNPRVVNGLPDPSECSFCKANRATGVKGCLEHYPFDPLTGEQ